MDQDNTCSCPWNKRVGQNTPAYILEYCSQCNEIHSFKRKDKSSSAHELSDCPECASRVGHMSYCPLAPWNKKPELSEGMRALEERVGHLSKACSSGELEMYRAGGRAALTWASERIGKHSDHYMGATYASIEKAGLLKEAANLIKP